MKRVWLGLLAALFVLQSGYVVYTIVQAETTLQEGTVYRFNTEPVDPYDPFRGRYVLLHFAVEDKEYLLADGENCDAWQLGRPVYGVLGADADGNAEIVSIQHSADAGSKDILQLSVHCVTYEQPQLRITLPFKRFYANELLAPELEQQAREFADSSYLLVRVRGNYAVPERLEIGK